jgi:hypothetical protein
VRARTKGQAKGPSESYIAGCWWCWVLGAGCWVLGARCSVLGAGAGACAAAAACAGALATSDVRAGAQMTAPIQRATHVAVYVLAAVSKCGSTSRAYFRAYSEPAPNCTHANPIAAQVLGYPRAHAIQKRAVEYSSTHLMALGVIQLVPLDPQGVIVEGDPEVNVDPAPRPCSQMIVPIQRGTRVLVPLLDSLMFGRVLK